MAFAKASREGCSGHSGVVGGATALHDQRIRQTVSSHEMSRSGKLYALHRGQKVNNLAQDVFLLAYVQGFINPLQRYPGNAVLDYIFASEMAADGHIVRNCLRHGDRGFSKKCCDGMLVVDSLEHIAGETGDANDSGRNIRDIHANDVIETATPYLRDGVRRAETYCYAEVVDFVLEG